MEVLVSGVTSKDGKRIAYVSFQEKDRYAEITIPDCDLVKNTGFSQDELDQMVGYLKDNMTLLKKEAASINPIKGMMKDGK